MKTGINVVVRSNLSGVWVGKLAGRDDDTVSLENARRIWSWEGALSCSEIATIGIDAKRSVVCPPVNVDVGGGICEVIEYKGPLWLVV